MRGFTADVQATPIKAGLRGAAKAIKTGVVAAAPYDGVTPDGVHIRDNVQVGRSRTKSGPGREVWTVGIKHGKSVLADTARNRKKGTVGKKVATDGEAFYWKFIEFGTSKRPANPFFRPGAAAAIGAANDAFSKEMGKSVARLEKKYNIT